MSKSTPINQLPIGAAHQGPGYMGQPSGPPADLINDDEATIQEVMSHFTAESNGRPSTAPQQALPFPTPAPGGVFQAPPAAGHAAGPPYYNGPEAAGFQGATEPAFQGRLPAWVEDAKAVLLMAAVVFLVFMSPVGPFVAKYLPLDKIPHSDSALKAVLSAASIFLLQKHM